MNYEIRRTLIEYFKRNPKQFHWHITSNLQWHRYEKQVALISQKLKKGSLVLDIGCGNGHTTALLATHTINVIGIDLSESPVWQTFENYGARFVVADALNLPFKCEKFDAVISFGVMEHLKDDDGFINQVYRILKKGGYNFVFNLPNKYGLSEVLGQVLGGIEPHDRKYTKNEIATLFYDTGFSELKIERENFFPAQVGRISKLLGEIYNKYYLLIDKMDFLLCKLFPLNLISHSFTICCKKLLDSNGS